MASGSRSVSRVELIDDGEQASTSAACEPVGVSEDCLARRISGGVPGITRPRCVRFVHTASCDSGSQSEEPTDDDISLQYVLKWVTRITRRCHAGWDASAHAELDLRLLKATNKWRRLSSVTEPGQLPTRLAGDDEDLFRAHLQDLWAFAAGTETTRDRDGYLSSVHGVETVE